MPQASQPKLQSREECVPSHLAICILLERCEMRSKVPAYRSVMRRRSRRRTSSAGLWRWLVLRFRLH